MITINFEPVTTVEVSSQTRTVLCLSRYAMEW